ncbi:YiiX/YebB-like N1pC/P60 family cysteine hydrolase [Pseudomonadota bacterium AL_CKDN230030165-1A_HGKHYDSX7]
MLAALTLGAVLPSLAQAARADATALPAGAQAGDLIFRRGTAAISDAVLAVDPGEFSHVGMLVGGPGAWQVVHATPSEMPGRADGVVLDELAFYLDPVRAEDHAVYGVHADPAQHARAVSAALAARGQGFELAHAGGTYCTALVWQAWRTAGVDLQVPFTTLAIPLLQGKYLLPSALQASPRLQALTRR